MCSLALAPAGHASFPGKNGPLVLSLENCYFSRYLARVPWRGGELRPITERCGPQHDAEKTPPSFEHPDAAPDGASLLATQDDVGRFVTMRPDGAGLDPVELPQRAEPVLSPSGPSFAPDGRRFAFESDRYEDGHDVEPLWAARIDGSAARRIREAMSCDRGESCSRFENPRWSPDGRLIAVEVYTFRPRRPDALRPGLWLIRARDGKAVRRLAGTRATDVDWSPDGRWLAFRTVYLQREIEGGASGGNIYVVSRDGERRRTLVHREDIAETEPTWSPNGRWIVWVSLDFSAGDVGFEVFPSLWRVRRNGRDRVKMQDLPQPDVEESEYERPHLTWLPRAD